MTMKKDRFRAHYERLNRHFKLLVNRDDFQADIKAFRKKWEIEPGQLKTRSDEQRWWDEFHSKQETWHQKEWPKHRARLIKMNKEFPKTQNYVAIKEYEEAANLSNPLNAFYHELKIITKKYKLPPKWEGAIRAYVFTNRPEYNGLTGITIETSMHNFEGEGQIKLVLDGFITKQDLMDAWPDIKVHLEDIKLRQTYQPYNAAVFERNKMAYKLKAEGIKNTEIAKRLNEKYNESFTYADIPTLIRNYKQLSGMT